MSDQQPNAARRALIVGANDLTFTVPNSAVTGNSYARFRYSSTGGLSANGSAIDGEVEDFIQASLAHKVKGGGDQPIDDID